MLPDWLKDPLGRATYWFLTLIKPPDTFLFRNNEFRRLSRHLAELTYSGGTKIAFNELANPSGQEILEVGNILHHYIQVDHDVLDK